MFVIKVFYLKMFLGKCCVFQNTLFNIIINVKIFKKYFLNFIKYFFFSKILFNNNELWAPTSLPKNSFWVVSKGIKTQSFYSNLEIILKSWSFGTSIENAIQNVVWAHQTLQLSLLQWIYYNTIVCSVYGKPMAHQIRATNAMTNRKMKIMTSHDSCLIHVQLWWGATHWNARW